MLWRLRLAANVGVSVRNESVRHEALFVRAMVRDRPYQLTWRWGEVGGSLCEPAEWPVVNTVCQGRRLSMHSACRGPSIERLSWARGLASSRKRLHLPNRVACS
jgi:hypothetical protein